MPVLTLDYRHCDRKRPKFIKHIEIEGIAAQARQQLVGRGVDAITFDTLRQIDRLKINGIDFALEVSTDYAVHDEQGNHVFGVCEFDPAMPDAAMVSISPVGESLSELLALSTLAHELGHALVAFSIGSLPLSFESSEAETVSATLGLTSLRAGLIAGAIGLALVLLYSLLYYRVLGLLVALSLVASGAMVYAILVLLGRYMGYTLDLAGIAGLIIGIGTTADSFVVFFERIKDEIREGRSFRSAVPRGWARARKTILSGNAVTFIAALVLYLLAVGQVKGFAFTLGLTTILDVVVVFLVTWPLVYLASKSATLAKPAYNGLGAVQQVARERRAAATSTGRG